MRSLIGRIAGPDGYRGPAPDLSGELEAPAEVRVWPVPDVPSCAIMLSCKGARRTVTAAQFRPPPPYRHVGRVRPGAPWPRRSARFGWPSPRRQRSSTWQLCAPAAVARQGRPGAGARPVPSGHRAPDCGEDTRRPAWRSVPGEPSRQCRIAAAPALGTRRTAVRSGTAGHRPGSPSAPLRSAARPRGSRPGASSPPRCDATAAVPGRARRSGP